MSRNRFPCTLSLDFFTWLGKNGTLQKQNPKDQVNLHQETPQPRSAVRHPDVGEGKDWVQLMARGPPRKDEVTFQVLAMMRQLAEKRTVKGEGAMTKKTRDLGTPCT